MSKPTTVEAYIAGFPDDVQPILQDVCDAIRRALPGAEERIRYDMAAFMFTGRYALHVGGWKKHVGLYPVGELPPELEAQVAPYRSKKDSVTFVYAKPVPYDLIEQIAAALAQRHA